MNYMELEGKKALVTGASRGLGRGIALALAEKGAAVAVNYRSCKNEAEEVCSLIKEKGGEAFVVKADVSDSGSVRDMFAKVEKRFGCIDILVNNAGTTKNQDIFETSEEDWNFIINTDLKSCFLCAKEAMVIMKAQKSGRIVNVSSIVGHRGALYGHVHYASAKSGMFGFTKTLARTAAPLGVTVNAVAPGIIATELLYSTHGEEEVEKLSGNVPLGLGTVRDIGLGVAFLCGEGGRYITGATLDINGGMYLR
jgi:NAD(P)-dependent dehydrogenase (short-subunit alcohol dehydrogenase family)